MYNEILDFWFNELEPSQWWKKDAEFDSMINNRFGHIYKKAKSGELFSWRETPKGSLAEIIVLDQFSRNIYRDMPGSFSCDPLALALSQFSISKGFDKELSQTEQSFLYLPFMHSESAKIHNEAIKLYEKLDNPASLAFEMKHKEIIDRFNRYPHRNKILGRESTAEEIEFLKQPDSGF